MLDYFIKSNGNLNYTLYAHFEDEIGGNEQPISLDRLKEILTYSEDKAFKCHYRDHLITDTQLTDFLKHFKFIFGKEFEVQQREVLQKLKLQFNCTDFEADTIYYNNALRTIIDKAILTDISRRTINKKEFISTIDRSKLIFNEWYIRLRSKKDFLKRVSDTIKGTGSHNPSKSKYILIGQNILSADNNELPILAFIEHVTHIYYRMNHCLRNSKPVTFILELDNASLIALKKLLIKNSIGFNDGYEEISFNHDFFNADPIVNLTQNSNRISKSSYSIKLISESTLRNAFDEIKKPKVIFYFSNKACPYVNSGDYQIFDVKYCENLKDIATLLFN